MDFDISSLDFSLDDDMDAGADMGGNGAQHAQQQEAFDNIDALDMSNASEEDNSLDFDMGGGEESDTGGDILNFDGFDLESTVDSSGPIDLVGSDGSEIAMGGEAADEPMELSLDDDALTLEEVEDFDESPVGFCGPW